MPVELEVESRSAQPQGLPRGQSVFLGTAASPGVAIGVLFAPAALCPLEDVPDEPASDPQAELELLEKALGALRRELSAQGAQDAGEIPAELHSLSGVYQLLLDDPVLWEELTRRITDGLWAPAALRDAVHSISAQFEAMENAYLRARAEDIRAVGRRLLRHLTDCDDKGWQPPGQTLLMGEGLGVACIMAIPRERLAGLVCTGGSPLSHGVIIAKALGIPAVVGVAGLKLTDGNGRRQAILDGYRGRVILDPKPEVLAEYARLLGEERHRAADLAMDRDLPARTTDGVTVDLQANIALLGEIRMAQDAGALSVGLYRSEIPFLIQETAPGEEAQTAVYRELLESFAPYPVTIRILDAGSDKPLPYLSQSEPNPALGQRGIRLLLANPEIFLAQLRALLRANAGMGNLRLLLPMVTLPAEVHAARCLIDQAYREVSKTVAGCVLPPVGVMVEVPAAALRIDAMAGLADFVSIGTNDLAQFVLAADRTNPSLGTLCDPLTPAVLSMIALTVQGARRQGIPVSVCGEMAGDPLGALLLLGLGVDSLSVSGSAMPRIRRLIRTWSSREAQRIWEQALALDSAEAVRTLVGQAIADKVGPMGPIAPSYT
jgi:phosphotransferase system enzyme I (PtsP)